jgi:hypothetical protein
VKRSTIQRKPALTEAQKQLRDAYRQAKQKGRSRSGARGEYVDGEWIPSQWEKHCKAELMLMYKAGEITEPTKQVITYTLFNEAGVGITEQIEIDFCFYHNNLKRHCRWDAKPPKVAHTKHGKRYPQKLHAEWLHKFKLLQFCEPDFNYRILEKGNTWRGIDI